MKRSIRRRTTAVLVWATPSMWVRALSAVFVLGTSAPAAADPNRDEAAARAQIEAEAREAHKTAERVLASLQRWSDGAREQLRAARGRGAPGEIACADEVLSRIDVALRHAHQDADAAASAYARGDVAAARREVVRIGHEHHAALVASTEACINADARTASR